MSGSFDDDVSEYEEESSSGPFVDVWLRQESNSSKIYESNNGHALVMCLEDFYPKTGLPSLKEISQRDKYNLELTLNKLGFSTEICVNSELTADGIKEIVRFYASSDYSNLASLAVFVSSHGESDFVYGIDGRRVYLKEIIELFGYNESLNEKPKMFFIDSCRNDKSDVFHPRKSYEPSRPDFLIGHATANGFSSFGNTSTGSVYISSLCQMLDKYALSIRRLDMASILTRTHRRVGQSNAEKQYPCFFSSLTKDFYFG